MAKTFFKYLVSLCFLAVLLINQAWGFSNDIKSIHYSTKESSSQAQIHAHQALHSVFGLEEDRQPLADLFSGEKEGEFDEEVKIGSESSADFLIWSNSFLDRNIWNKTSGLYADYRLSNHQFTSNKKYVFFRVFRI